MTDLATAFFVLGAPRSGTTLLRVMLAGHPRLFSPPEMLLAPFETMAERAAYLTEHFWVKGGLRRALMELDGIDVDAAKALVASWEGKTIPEAYAALQARLGERTLVDKCPHLSMPDGRLERVLEWFPGARFVWIVRHPGSVTRSVQNMPMAEVMLKGYPGGAEHVWQVSNERIGAFVATLPDDRWIRIRYEDLVTDTEATLRPVAERLGLPYDPAMATPYEGDRMRSGPKGARAIGDPNLAGRGKVDPTLATKWLDGFDPDALTPEAKALAQQLGYDIDAMPRPKIAAVSDATASLFATAQRLEQAIDLPMDLDALEGRRFLLRVLFASVETFLEHTDPDRPTFTPSLGPTRKYFADNPDTDYLRAPVSFQQPGRAYRITGRIPEGTRYVGLLNYGRGGRIGHRLTDAQLDVDADGRFAAWLAPEPPPGGETAVWLKADGDETALMVRQYFTDRAAEAPIEVDIAYVGEAAPHAPLAVPDVHKALQRAERMLEAVFQRTLGALQTVRQAALNRFVPIGGEELFPTPDNTYQACWYRFGGDQVMLVRGRLPKARYIAFTLYNAWMESLDYGAIPCHRNHTQIALDDDGTFELCLAHRDPGHPNWLHTGGHHAGYLLQRILLTEEATPPELTLQVMYEPEWDAEKARREG